jgi:hypothetical protein
VRRVFVCWRAQGSKRLRQRRQVGWRGYASSAATVAEIYCARLLSFSDSPGSMQALTCCWTDCASATPWAWQAPASTKAVGVSCGPARAASEPDQPYTIHMIRMQPPSAMRTAGR